MPPSEPSPTPNERTRLPNLLLKTALFTVLMPGTFAMLIPLALVRERTAGGGMTLALASCLLAFGTALYLRSAWDFAVSGSGTPAPIDAPRRLVTRGFYRYTRNPMYVASLTLVAGWAILYEAPLLLAYAAGLFLFFSVFIKLYEEPRMAREFGDDYVAYSARVGRWLPRRLDR